MNTKLSYVRCEVMSVAYLWRMSDAVSEPERGCIAILIPGDKGDALVITLERAFFERKAREALGAEPPEVPARCTAADPLMRGVGNALRSEFPSRRAPSAVFLESLAGVIAIHLARNYCGQRAALRECVGLAPHRLERAQAYVEEHLAETVRVEQLATAVHMSPFHFARMFKQATGQSPHAYLTLRRVERAKQLLRDSRLALIEVASSVGFQTQGHFTEVFHRYAGLTPRHFRLAENGRNAKFPRKEQEESRQASA